MQQSKILDRIQEEFDESPHYMAEEILKLRAECKEKDEGFWGRACARTQKKLTESRASCARLRAALERIESNPRPESVSPMTRIFCRQVLANGDGQKELEAVKKVSYAVHYQEIDIAIKELRDEFGLGG